MEDGIADGFNVGATLDVGLKEKDGMEDGVVEIVIDGAECVGACDKDGETDGICDFL